MYDKHFLFKAKPFALTPDYRFFYKSQSHKRAMAYLEYGLEQAEGFIVVTGPVGSGKTTLIEGLMAHLDVRRLQAIHLVSTNLSPDELIMMIAQHLRINFPEQAPKSLIIHKIEQELRQIKLQGKRVILVIDEAQNLSEETLEELRMLSNFRLDGQPMLQSFLLGQEELKEALQRAGLEQFRQRIIAACHLSALNREECRGYILHRLQQVGWRSKPVIDPETFDLIYKHSKGIPRRINLVCDRLFLACYLEEKARIDPELAKNVLTELDAEVSQSDNALPAATVVKRTSVSPSSHDAAMAFKASLEAVMGYLEDQIVDKIDHLDRLNNEITELESRLKSLNTGRDGTNPALLPADRVAVYEADELA